MMTGLVLALALVGADENESAPATLREMIDAAVTQIEVLPVGDDEPAKPIVALRWANNQRGSEDGLTILYIHKGRPLATACLYPWAGNLIHDFEALGRGKIEARRKGTADVLWQPKESGVVFADIPDAPPPDATAAGRLRQLKTLAEQFQSTMLGWRPDDTDREELRLLPRPLYRYPAGKGPVIDGAVFAFVMGTDPETLLLLEAVEEKAVEEKGAVKWQYGFARRTSGKLEGRHRDKVVWSAARFPDTRDPRQPRYAAGTPIPPELLPTEK